MNAKQYVDYYKQGAINGATYDYNRNGNPGGYLSLQDNIDDYTSLMEGRFTRYSGSNSDCENITNRHRLGEASISKESYD